MSEHLSLSTEYTVNIIEKQSLKSIYLKSTGQLLLKYNCREPDQYIGVVISSAGIYIPGLLCVPTELINKAAHDLKMRHDAVYNVRVEGMKLYVLGETQAILIGCTVIPANLWHRVAYRVQRMEPLQCYGDLGKRDYANAQLKKERVRYERVIS